MTVSTQYNPNHDLNAYLIDAGASKTVYALVTPETEEAKRQTLGVKRVTLGIDPSPFEDYLDMFRGAWTKKQDALHETFFQTWHEWSAPVVDLDRANFPYYYPCNGASEPIRHLIFAQAALNQRDYDGDQPLIHVFEGEYEGYKAMAEAAGLEIIEHSRDNWRSVSAETVEECSEHLFRPGRDLFFLSQPSAIDGNVWTDFNEFIASMPKDSVVVDVTYVGAVPRSAVKERFDVNPESVRAVIFSLSKPFGVYYDRIGGIWMRSEDPGLFGNKWFKNLTSINLGTKLMQNNAVFDFPERYGGLQQEAMIHVGLNLGLSMKQCDVYILALGYGTNPELSDYLLRAGNQRICLTPYMARKLGTEGEGG